MHAIDQKEGLQDLSNQPMYLLELEIMKKVSTNQSSIMPKYLLQIFRAENCVENYMLTV